MQTATATNHRGPSLDFLHKAFVLGLEIRVFDKAIVYCVDGRDIALTLVFVRPADIRTSKDPDFQSRDLCKRSIIAAYQTLGYYVWIMPSGLILPIYLCSADRLAQPLLLHAVLLPPRETETILCYPLTHPHYFRKSAHGRYCEKYPVQR